MVRQNDEEGAQAWFKKYTNKEPDLGRIIILVEDNIYQVLFDYGIENTLILLEYLHTQNSWIARDT
jgi:hypothetical protein